MSFEDIKKMMIDKEKLRSLQYRPPFDITLPRYVNDSDCGAAPICKYIGNLRKSCLKGYSSTLPVTIFSKCVEGIVILLGSIASITLEPPSPEKEIQGFSGQSQSNEDIKSRGTEKWTVLFMRK